MIGQLNLDFSARSRKVLSDPGKKTERITFTATDDLAEMLRMLADKMETTISEYCHTRVIECASRDIGEILLLQAKANKPLKDLLR
jgi:hypothetical protein